MKVIKIAAMTVVLLAGATTSHANLCGSVTNLDKKLKAETTKELAFFKTLFTETKHHGADGYNGRVLQCNRERDSRGGEIRTMLSHKDFADVRKTLKKPNLSPYFYKSTYRFLGTFLYKMRYLVWKEKGIWKVLIPYDAVLNLPVNNRIDLNWDHAKKLYERDQVEPTKVGSVTKYTPIDGAEPVQSTICGSTTYFKGKSKKYKDMDGDKAGKRDRANKFISLGKVEYAYKRGKDKNGKQEYSRRKGCRVKRNTHLYGVEPLSGRFVKILPEQWIMNNFVKVSEEHWNEPNNFELIILMKGYNESFLSKSERQKVERYIKKKDDYLKVRFGSMFMPHGGNQMYKANIVQRNNFSTMTTDRTFVHEVGHALGLDDEYAERSASDTKRHCAHTQYKKFDQTTGGVKHFVEEYTMCEGYGDQQNTIYQYIAVSRRALAEICKKDSDCGRKQYCNNRLGVNRCLADGTKTVGQSCVKTRECRSKDCEGGTCVCNSDSDCPSGKQCYKIIGKKNYCASSAKALGSRCTKNKQCRSNKCEKKKCVCNADSDCSSGKKCFKPIAKQNYCASTTKGLGASCKKNSECKSNDCEGRECVCKTDSDCPSGKKCKRVMGKKNYCYKASGGSKTLGKSCKKHKDCRSNRCEDKTCVCNADSDCSSGKKCYKPLGKKNYCASIGKALGTACKKSSECKSNDCEGGICVCKADSDCPSGQKCFRILGKKNYCSSTTKSLGKTCQKNEECRSNKCEKSQCVCKKDSDCPKGKKCKNKAFGANQCK